jgi:hypothetical protein
MAYSPIAYVSANTVKRLLRTANNKIRIGSPVPPNQITEEDLDGYILDASEYIDSFIRQVVLFDNLPIATYTEKPEITFAAGRFAAYFVHESLYPTYRTEKLGTAVIGWKSEAEDRLRLFVQHVNEGVYSDLSPATGGIQFITVEQFFQTQIGIRGLTTMQNDVENQTPIKLGNIDPYNDGSL